MKATKRDLLVLLGAALVAVATWLGLNLGKMLYADWAFLHAVRVQTEHAQQAPPVPPQGR